MKRTLFQIATVLFVFELFGGVILLLMQRKISSL